MVCARKFKAERNTICYSLLSLVHGNLCHVSVTLVLKQSNIVLIACYAVLKVQLSGSEAEEHHAPITQNKINISEH